MLIKGINSSTKSPNVYIIFTIYNTLKDLVLYDFKKEGKLFPYFEKKASLCKYFIQTRAQNMKYAELKWNVCERYIDWEIMGKIQVKEGKLCKRNLTPFLVHSTFHISLYSVSISSMCVWGNTCSVTCSPITSSWWCHRIFTTSWFIVCQVVIKERNLP